MASYYITLASVAPLRSAPNHRSELINELLFGEAMTSIDEGTEDWVKVKNKYDRYEGWVARNQIQEVSEDLFHHPTTKFTSQSVNRALINGVSILLPLGAFLTGMHNGKLEWGTTKIHYTGPYTDAAQHKISEHSLISTATEYLNTRYLWGGKSIFGIDCSGFVQSVFRLFQIWLPRDTGAQVKEGKELKNIEELQWGDLAFFENEQHRIMHVGLMLDHEKIIHSSGQVRIDRLDEHGILNVKTGKYSHRLATLKRILK